MKTERITKTTASFIQSSNNSKCLLPDEFKNRSVKRFAQSVEKWLKDRGEYHPISQADIRVHNSNYLFAVAETHDRIVLFKSEGIYA